MKPSIEYSDIVRFICKMSNKVDDCPIHKIFITDHVDRF